MNSFIGTYECKADAKGRLMIPAVLKKQLSAALQDGFVLKRAVFQPCLDVKIVNEFESTFPKKNNVIFNNKTV